MAGQRQLAKECHRTFILAAELRLSLSDVIHKLPAAWGIQSEDSVT